MRFSTQQWIAIATSLVVGVVTANEHRGVRGLKANDQVHNDRLLKKGMQQSSSNEGSYFDGMPQEDSFDFDHTPTFEGDKPEEDSEEEDSVDVESGDGGACPRSDPVDAEVVRSALKKFVDSLDESSDIEPTRLARGYHPNANDQGPDYHICTVVQQCLDPPFILSLGYMSAQSRGLAYKAVSKVMSQESFNMLQLQQHSNMLLGEMQDWATTCPGRCRELNDPDGLLEPVPGGPGSLADQSTEVPLANYETCGDMRAQGNWTFWYCNDEPRMVHQAQIDVSNAQYRLGNIWGEPHIHARNSWYDYFSVYGDMSENGGAFGMRFSGHHIDLNYRWNDKGDLVQDLPVFLGHNPLIVPEVTPPQLRAHDQRADADQFYTPLMWTNMAGVAQFAESEQLVLSCANELLSIAPGSYVPLSNWKSTGYIGALSFDGQEITDFDYFDLSTASDSEFNKMWSVVEYTLKFSRGHGPTSVERKIFRTQGKAVWTTSTPPEEGLPLTEDDLRSNLNFFNLRIETDDWVFFVMVNQLFTVISENEPTNHLHSVILPKELVNSNHACIEKDDPLCVPPPREEEDHHHAETISNAYKYESLMWEERNLRSNVTLNVDAFDEAVRATSEDLCGLGLTATLFDENAEQVYQETFGTTYFDFGGYLNHSDAKDGWTGDTTMSLYSNSKVLAAVSFLAAVVDTGLGYLDEPIYHSFPDYLTEDDVAGRATPRMILSHSSGLAAYTRSNLSDPYYVCIYDDSTTLAECLGEFLLTDETLTSVPGEEASYRNEPFDVLGELITRKTGLSNYGEAFKQYVADPIGMDDTTIDCPGVKSTSEKPHPSWGFCSTAHDMAKLVQVFGNRGKKLDGTQVLSESSVQQLFSRGTGVALNGDSPLPVPYLALGRCYNRVVADIYVNSILGYGLGTMFFAGTKGQLFGHAGTSGGFWFVAPGRFSAYFGWMHDPSNFDFGSAYDLVGKIIDKLELSSSFMVSNPNDLLGLPLEFEDIEICGDMYVDYWSMLGLKENPIQGPCSSTRRVTETGSSAEFELAQIIKEQTGNVLLQL